MIQYIKFLNLLRVTAMLERATEETEINDLFWEREALLKKQPQLISSLTTLSFLKGTKMVKTPEELELMEKILEDLIQTLNTTAELLEEMKEEEEEEDGPDADIDGAFY